MSGEIHLGVRALKGIELLIRGVRFLASVILPRGREAFCPAVN